MAATIDTQRKAADDVQQEVSDDVRQEASAGVRQEASAGVRQEAADDLQCRAVEEERRATGTRGIRKIAETFLALDRHDRCLVSQIMFFAAYIGWMVPNILILLTSFSSQLSPHVNMVHLEWAVLSVLLLREILFGRWDRRAFIGAVAFAFLAYMAHRTGLEALCETSLIVFAGRNVPFRRVAWVSFIAIAGLVAVVVASSQAGIVVDGVAGNGGRIRHNLGFLHPNAAPAFCFFALGLWIYLRGKKYGIIDTVAWVVLTVALMMYTDSRTSCGLSLALAVTAFIAKFVPDKAFRFTVLRFPPLAIVGVGSAVVCGTVAVWLFASYDPSSGWMVELNRLLTNRVVLGHNVIAEFGFPLFGAPLTQAVDGSVFDIGTGQWVAAGAASTAVIDCTYVYLMAYFGVVYAVVAAVLVTGANLQAWRAGNWQLLVVSGFIALHGIAEMCCPYLYFNPFLFLLGGLFYAGYDGYADKHRVEECVSITSVQA